MISYNVNSIIHYLMNPAEKAMAPHSSTLAWKMPWTEEPGRLQSMGSHRVGHDWATSLLLFTFMHWRRKWQPTSSALAWRILGMGEPDGLLTMGLHRVGHDWSNLAAAAAAATAMNHVLKNTENILTSQHLIMSHLFSPTLINTPTFCCQ